MQSSARYCLQISHYCCIDCILIHHHSTRHTSPPPVPSTNTKSETRGSFRPRIGSTFASRLVAGTFDSRASSSTPSALRPVSPALASSHYTESAQCIPRPRTRRTHRARPVSATVGVSATGAPDCLCSVHPILKLTAIRTLSLDMAVRCWQASRCPTCPRNRSARWRRLCKRRKDGDARSLRLEA